MLEVFYAYKEGYKCNYCVLKTTILCNMYKIKLQNSCDSVYVDLFVVKWMFFFRGFYKSLTENPLKCFYKITLDLLYFWNVYDVSLWEKLAITVKLCFIESWAMICEATF